MQDELEQKVRARAYEIWQQEGCVPGREDEHWRRAEAEVRAGRGAAPAAQAEAGDDTRAAVSPAGASIEAAVIEAPVKKTRTRRASTKVEQAEAIPPVTPKRRRSPAARVTSH